MLDIGSVTYAPSNNCKYYFDEYSFVKLRYPL